jgi:hypothetical protein
LENNKIVVPIDMKLKKKNLSSNWIEGPRVVI